jgi:phage tail sheath gpL-like
MTIPSGLRIPFMFVEFDPSRAFQGPAVLSYKALIMGQRLASGTIGSTRIDRITSAQTAQTYYGAGSQLAFMCAAWLNNNKYTELYAASLADAGTGVKATTTLTITGPATASGSVYLYINGVRIVATVAAADSAASIGDAIVAQISTLHAVTAVNVTGTVTLTARNAGACGEEIDARLNYNSGEALPTGVAITIAAGTSGANNPDVDDILDILGDEWYNVIVCPWTDDTNMDLLEAELSDRFGPMRQIDGVACIAFKPARSTSDKAAAITAITAYGNARNSPHVSCPGVYKYLESASEIAAAYAAQIAYEGSIDPARPFQTLALTGIHGPEITQRLTNTENNTMLTDGISTLTVDATGTVRIQRAITTYQTNGAGAADIAYLDVNTMLNLMYLRYSFRNRIMVKYPRAKLADDDSRIAPGQSVITPKIGKAEAIAWARQMEELGLVEDIDQFKADLVCQRSSSDPNRLEWILPPDLINQFVVGAASIQFLLQG